AAGPRKGLGPPAPRAARGRPPLGARDRESRRAPMSGDLGESEATPASTPLDFPKPYESRRCTDVICVVVFGLFVVLFVVVSLAGVADGNIAKLYRFG
ncbi:unnamed protein product, partial [Prorocentrum cordatum]